MPVAPASRVARPEAQRQPEPAKAPAAPVAKDVTKEDMQKALDAVRAKRANQQPALQAKPQQKAAPPLPAIEDPSELEDIVEDEEASAPPVKRQGFGAPAESCPPMKSLVQRKPGKGEASTRTE
jgi:hypothetical protein